ncbi:hypothetical protein NESM_000807200 [Novymonas esmeraldas]|uniref:Uncharacterized protein n=1 Tax=Novymonas esmeraldas TaxID=1808958 RepID=A0AAW0EYV9_9TRYP
MADAAAAHVVHDVGGHVEGQSQFVRAQRRHLARETRMLQLALEELQEEEDRVTREGADLMRAVEQEQHELVRCLAHFALVQHTTADEHLQSPSVQRVVGDEEEGLTCSDGVAAAAAVAACTALEKYAAEQRGATEVTRQRATRAREAPSQPPVSDCDASAVLVDELHHSCGAAPACEAAEVRALRHELEMLLEMTAEAEESADATLLRLGRTLFC